MELKCLALFRKLQLARGGRTLENRTKSCMMSNCTEWSHTLKFYKVRESNEIILKTLEM